MIEVIESLFWRYKLNDRSYHLEVRHSLSIPSLAQRAGATAWLLNG
jgi:hypothetical protein